MMADGLLAFFNLGPPELAMILVAALLIFGKRLPEVGKSLGRGIIEFKKGLQGMQNDINRPADDQPDQQDQVDKGSDENPPQAG